MNKYKVSITKTYTIDVLAKDGAEASNLAETFLDAQMLAGVEHYYQTGDTDFHAYDVTLTDDPFNAVND